jgi:hypothetical protein
VAAALAWHGLTRIYAAACPLFAVISAAELTIWTNGAVLWWTARG